ncbi:MAG: transporter [Gemmatimonadota bacterium]|nr:transporter [Gemmatimonadota bacterium]
MTFVPVKSAMLVLAFVGAVPVLAQTDYYNTDAGRPLTVEDAYPTERYAFELQIAPLRLERAEGGIYQWGIEPEIAYGIFPRTHIEIGAPLSYVDVGGGRRRSGLAGLELSVLHNLNAETSIPALGIAGGVLLPVGGLGPDKAYFSTKGIATRTFSWARFHLNGEYTFGENAEALPAGASAAGRPEVARWLAGLAADKAFPLRSMLVGAEVFARQPLESEEDVAWNVATGIRYQLTPYFNVDGGVGKQLSGDDRSWFFTFGLSRAFSIRSLFPVR